MVDQVLWHYDLHEITKGFVRTQRAGPDILELLLLLFYTDS